MSTVKRAYSDCLSRIDTVYILSKGLYSLQDHQLNTGLDDLNALHVLLTATYAEVSPTKNIGIYSTLTIPQCWTLKIKLRRSRASNYRNCVH
jgi:hypothetical protein